MGSVGFRHYELETLRQRLRRAHLRWQIGLEADVRSYPTILTVL